MQEIPRIEPIIAILGPTASGKSALAIEIAKFYDGEIISVDSRQIYRGMDIGTGKVEWDENFPRPFAKGSLPAGGGEGLSSHVYYSEGIPHHLLDIVDPNDAYNVTDFVRDATTAIEDIQSRGKLPILCGGTGFWAQALLDGQTFPSTPPNPELRAELSHLSAEALFAQLQTLDPERAATIDQHNPVRLIRAIEIAQARIKNTPSMCHPGPDPGSRFEFSLNTKMQPGPRPPVGECGGTPPFNVTIIALNPPIEELRAKIKKRLDERFDQGMIGEVQALHDQGISWERLESFGLEYRWIARFLQQTVDEKTMREKLYFDSIHYAKRQLTWLRRWERQGAKIQWFSTSKEAVQFIKATLLKK